MSDVDSSITHMVKWYSDKRPLYEKLSKRIKKKLDELFIEKKISYLAIQERTKSISSFREKLVRKKYSKADECKDLSGIRIIVSMLFEIDSVVKVLIETFKIVDGIKDKALDLKPNEFGYRSIHVVATLTQEEAQKYKRFSGMFFEIQVRTIVQHLWAEFEHRYRYKSPVTLPPDLQHQISKLAAKAEDVDEHFQRVMAQLDEHARIELKRHKG